MGSELLQALIKDLYIHEAAGGFLHVVLDDYNVEDGYIHWCLTEAIRRGCDMSLPWCHTQHELIGMMLLAMPLDDREDFLRNVGGS